MKNYGVVLFDHRQDIISVIDHNLSRNKADEIAAKYREKWKLPGLTFEHMGHHEEAEAEHCVDCKDLLTAKMSKAAG